MTPAPASRVVVVACSTGGPRALASLVPALPRPLGAGGLLVQHMAPGFTRRFAQRLDRGAALDVREATSGDRLDGGSLLVAPAGRHLRVATDGEVSLSHAAPVGALRPRADLTISDAVRAFGERVVLCVLTGLGRDALDGAREVREAGGRVLVQDEATSTVYGMGRAVAEAGLADAVLPLGEMADAVREEVDPGSQRPAARTPRAGDPRTLALETTS